MSIRTEKCEWADQCKMLDSNFKTQRVFYCLKAISESYKNIHWKKRANYNIKPHIDRWDQITFTLNFSNPLFRIHSLHNKCEFRKSKNQIAIPFLMFKKPLNYIKKQDISYNNTNFSFDLPSRLESSIAYSLFLFQEINFLKNIQKQFSHNSENDIYLYLYIASMIASAKSPLKYGICISTLIKNTIDDYLETSYSIPMAKIGEINQLYRKFEKYEPSIMDMEIIKVSEKNKISNQDLNTIYLLMDTCFRVRDSFQEFENTLFPIFALRNYFYYFREYFPTSENRFNKTDDEIVNIFIDITIIYLKELFNELLSFEKLTDILSNSKKTETAMIEATNLNFFFNIIDKMFPAIIPIDQNMEDGKIEVIALSESNIQYKLFFTPFINILKKIIDKNKFQNNSISFFRIKALFLFLNIENLLPKILKFLKLHYFFMKLLFVYDISLESAESVNVKFEVDDIGYWIKEPSSLKYFFNRYKYEDNYLNISTRKKTIKKPYFTNSIISLPDFERSAFPIEVEYGLGRGLTVFLIFLSLLAVTPIFFKGDIISYVLGGIIPIVVLILTTFSLGNWSLTHRLVKPFKIIFASISLLIFIKIVMIYIGRIFPTIQESDIYQWGKRFFNSSI